MRWLSRYALSLLVLLPIVATAQSAPTGSIVIGKRDSLWSRAINEQRPYLVYTPPSYNDTTYLPHPYPVLYLLDAEAHFHSVTGLAQILGTGVNGTFVLPEMIVVGIPNTTDRMRDLSPTRATKGPDGKPFRLPTNTSGGMPNFLRFVKDELIPHIDSTYRTAPYRVFIGHSLGGITAIEALYTMPQTFNAYIAIDPSLWWDDQLLLKQAKAYFSKQGGLDNRVLYVAQANTLNPDDSTANMHFNAIMQFNSVMEAYNQTGLRYAFRYYSGDDHGSVPMIAEYDGLRFIFNDYRLDLLRGLDHPTYLTDHYTKLSKLMGYGVTPPEGMVDMLGQIEVTRDSSKALDLLQLNTTLYPKSAHAWASLGDLAMARKDTARARAAYEKARSINPGNARAKEALSKLKE